MVRLSLFSLLPLLVACACPPEVATFNANGCVGRPGQVMTLHFDVRQEVYEHPLPGGELEAEIVRSSVDVLRRLATVHVRIRNRGDVEVRMPRDGIVLHHAGEPVVKPRSLDFDTSPNVKPGEQKLFVWEFALGKPPVTGRFPLTLDGMYLWQGGERAGELPGPWQLSLALAGTGTPVIEAEPGRRAHPDDEGADEAGEPEPGEEPQGGPWAGDRPPR